MKRFNTDLTAAGRPGRSGWEKGRRTLSLAVVSLLAVATVFAFSWQANPGQSVPGVTAADDCQNFPETGFKACGRFLQYWRQNGNLSQQGFPISDEFEEKNQPPPAGDGKIYKVQYFQRARFEYHPENKPPYDVLLGLLGTEQYRSKYVAPVSTAPALVIRSQRYETNIGGVAAKPGQRYLVIDVVLTNTSNTLLTTYVGAFTVNTSNLYDYRVADITYVQPKSFKQKELNLGESAGGELIFEFGADDNPKSLTFQTYPVKYTTLL